MRRLRRIVRGALGALVPVVVACCGFLGAGLAGEPLDGIEDVHFHPVEKPAVRASVEWRF